MPCKTFTLPYPDSIASTASSGLDVLDGSWLAKIRLLNFNVGSDDRRGALSKDTPAIHHDDGVGDGHDELHVVLDEHHCEVGCAQVENVFA